MCILLFVETCYFGVKIHFSINRSNNSCMKKNNFNSTNQMNASISIKCFIDVYTPNMACTLIFTQWFPQTIVDCHSGGADSIGGGVIQLYRNH